MSDIASELKKLKRARAAIEAGRNATMRAADHETPEVLNDLSEALGDSPVYTQIKAKLDHAEEMLDAYSVDMSLSITLISDLILNLERLMQ